MPQPSHDYPSQFGLMERILASVGKLLTNPRNVMRPHLPNVRYHSSGGAPANWPKQWVQDVLPVAGSVYRQITFTTPGAPAGHWNVTVTPTFETSACELTDKQLAKAGYRLAEVLKKVLP